MAGGAPAIWAAPAAAFPGGPPSERVLFPQPADGAAAAINPPGFAWWRAQGAARYRLSIRDRAGRKVYESPLLENPVHLPSSVLPPGEYSWDVEACNAAGDALARRGAWRFQVPGGLREFPWQDPKRLLARVPGTHPRYMFLRDRLPEIRKTLQTTRKRAWHEVRSDAERFLTAPLPVPPQYHTFPDKVRQRMGYTTYFRQFRRHVDTAMGSLALAYVLSGDERFGIAAKKILDRKSVV